MLNLDRSEIQLKVHSRTSSILSVWIEGVRFIAVIYVSKHSYPRSYHSFAPSIFFFSEVRFTMIWEQKWLVPRIEDCVCDRICYIFCLLFKFRLCIRKQFKEFQLNFELKRSVMMGSLFGLFVMVPTNLSKRIINVLTNMAFQKQIVMFFLEIFSRISTRNVIPSFVGIIILLKMWITWWGKQPQNYLVPRTGKTM